MKTFLLSVVATVMLAMSVPQKADAQVIYYGGGGYYPSRGYNNAYRYGYGVQPRYYNNGYYNRGYYGNSYYNNGYYRGINNRGYRGGYYGRGGYGRGGRGGIYFSF